MQNRIRIASSCIVGLSLWLSAHGAQAATFRVQAMPLDKALVVVAGEARVSIGGLSPAACGKQRVVLSGEMSVDEALTHLLSASPCTVEKLGPGIYRLSLRPPPRRPLHPRPVTPDRSEPAPQDVWVTASRRVLPLNRVLPAVTVLHTPQIYDQGGGLADLSRRVPGLTTTNLGSGRNKIMLRGLSDSVYTGRTQSTVGLYLDDTPITYNAPDPNLRLTDMARVEIAKGPQGALYGSGAISGVVRLVPNRPDLNTVGLIVSTEGMATEKGAPSASGALTVNLPVIEDRLAVRFTAYAERDGGYIDDLGIGRTRINRTRRDGYRLSATWVPASDWRVSAGVTNQAINSENTQYAEGVLGPFRRDVDHAEPHDNDFLQAHLTAERALSIGDLKLSAARVVHSLASRYDASDLGPLIDTSDPRGLAYDEAQEIRLDVQELTLVSPGDGRLRWLVGLFATRQAEDVENTLTDLGQAASLYTEDRKDRLSEVAAFGEISYDLTPVWSLTAGGRIARVKHVMDAQIDDGVRPRPLATPTFGDERLIDGQRNDRHSSYKLAVTYRASDRLSLYVQSAEGYRNGGFNSTAFTHLTPVPPTYGDDELTSYEAGLRWRDAHNRLRLDAAVYQVSWRNIQGDHLQANGLPVSLNVGDGSNLGLEWSLDYAGAAWRWTVAGLINRPELARAFDPAIASEDAGLPGTAQNMFSARLRHEGRLKRFAGAGLGLEANLGYTGLSRTGLHQDASAKMGGYMAVDLGADVTRAHRRWTLQLTNATNAGKNSFAYGNPFNLDHDRQFTPLRPRSLRLGLSWSY